MKPLSREDLHTLEHYAQIRSDFRARVMAHKENRRVALGDHATLYFEDVLTMQYQVQEMLRIEKIFEAEGIQDELDAYNPLIPNGSNLKATFMIEYADVEERRTALARLIGIETQIWLRAKGFDKVFPIANEDLERSTTEKTSSVHFVRFEFSPEMVAALKSGTELEAGCDHPAYPIEVVVAGPVREALVADFD